MASKSLLGMGMTDKSRALKRVTRPKCEDGEERGRVGVTWANWRVLVGIIPPKVCVSEP